MATVLSLSFPDPLQRLCAEPHYMQSCSSVSSRLSSETTRRTYHPSMSTYSLQSSSSLPHTPWPLPDDRTLPKLASCDVLESKNDFVITTTESGDVDVPPESSNSSAKAYSPGLDGTLHDDDSTFVDTLCDSDDVVPFPRLDIAAPETGDAIETLDFAISCDSSDTSLETSPGHSPFNRWLSTLRRRHLPHGPLSREVNNGSDLISSPHAPGSRHHKHQKSLSLTSSLGLVTTVRSASVTLAGTSIAPTSKRALHQGHFSSDTTTGSCFESWMSTESLAVPYEPAIDEKAWCRSIQRSNIMEEILSSEESYVSDMKAMMHVYFTLLASTSTVSACRKESIQRSIGQIIQLHEELLSELQKVVPKPLPPQGPLSPQHWLRRSRHTRWRSVETALIHPKASARRRWLRHSLDFGSANACSTGSLTVTTNTVLNVAKVFDRFMRRFLTYEAYVAHNEILNEEACSTSRLIPAWDVYERGVEALAPSTNAISQRDTNSRKGLTLADLGIKPVQRICKYPLFFSQLCKQTPACDDPAVHAELEKVLFRLQETAEEINDARDNPKTRHLIETTWLLQDRLIFHDMPETYKVTLLRHLGHVVLCGALHIAFEGPDGAKGHYMICILFRSWLVLATVGTSSFAYNVNAVIPVFNASVEAPDNGRGLQCHTAPYTWKLVFQYQQRYYELLMSACSEVEEKEWKGHLRSRIAAEAKEAAENRPSSSDTLSYNTLNVKALGPAFESHSGFTRRLSIRRAATLGPKTNLRQVIIKNTAAQKLGQPEHEEANLVMRSKSHMSSSNMSTIAPRRAERVRLEGLLSDVWTREKIPYPGMAIRRMENPIKASANSVMRKLSMASITSNFSKRSASFNGLNHHPDDIRVVSQRAFYATASRTRRPDKRRPPRSFPTVVDFHTTPSAFLPEDFELKKPMLMPRRQRLVKRTMTMDSAMSSPIVHPPVPRPSSTQDKATLVNETTLLKPPSPPHSSNDSGYSSVDHRNNSTEVQHHEDNSLDPSTFKGPVKTRSRLFKFLGVKKD